ncbi:ABC transporter ATP-binding protein [Pseudorhodobacter sp. E13]|uniref:ABC transporter ATP-binding protein n=1 Tax=Pseudorhodobacter sp. E13 TaxID=2487931 RepID=UPI000F8F4AC4|nr:ABC transporter ATP-binding protein [Pseudorhodobacter sp. E13]RUS59617.1 ABC transporter ATP-binding protein [Pseudorhodobacter sp. E13]
MLDLSAINAAYGNVQVLRGLSLTAKPGEVTCVMGRNGAGKTTMLRAIMGQVPVTAGSITLNGQPLHSLPAHEVPRHGIGYVPQGRRLFGELTVAQNIQIGLMTRQKGAKTRDAVLSLFPRLRERLSQRASTLSGGEQQMLAIARALCLEPSVLLLDEPTEGLQPSMITLIRDTLLTLKSTGVATILVEQRVDAVLSMADHIAFVTHGTVAETLQNTNLSSATPQFQKYVGV